MKKKLFCLAALMLTLSLLCIPALAALDYGVIYDETESLGSDTLTLLGETTLPMASEQLGIEMRVDVLTVMTSDTIEDAAGSVYHKFGYGLGDERRGVTLTILMEPVESGYAMAPGNWCIYVGGSDESLTGSDLRDTVTAAVAPYMADRAWNGDDLTMSATALTQAAEAMVSSVTNYFADFAGEEAAPEPSEPAEPTEPAEPAEPSEEISMNYVLDLAGLLSFDEWKALEKRAAELSAQHGCGIYTVTVENYADYGADIESVIEDAYHQLELGEGSGRDGIVLMLSMADRSFATFVCGEQAERAFSDYGLKQLEPVFLDRFAENDWYGGFADYLQTCSTYLALAERGTPVQASPWGNVAIAVVIAVVIALVVCLILKGKMKSVRRKTEANTYMTAAGLHLTERQDLYTYTTESRRKLESKSSGDSERFSGSSGGHGRSGSF